jgi:glucosamine--fructose-6-phosphate aminotransferase (isomerizing)
MESLGRFPDPFLEEIAGQPAALRRAGAAVADQLSVLERLAGERGKPVAFTGMGSSYHACYPAVTTLASAGASATMVDAAELLHFRRPALGPDALLVAVSQSGRSAEVVRLVEAVLEPERRPVVAAVTNGVDNPVAGGADLVIETRAGDELGPSTMSFAAALVALSAVARVLGGETPARAMEGVAADVEACAAVAERLLAFPVDEAMRLSEWLAGRASLVVLGRGGARAAAEMGALTLKEAARFPAESLESAQFRHGPLELAGPDLAAVVIATEVETRPLDLGLAADLSRAGAAVLVVTDGTVEPEPQVEVIATGPLHRLLSPAVAVIPLQLLAWRLAVERGRRPGTFTVAAKVTTVE